MLKVARHGSMASASVSKIEFERKPRSGRFHTDSQQGWHENAYKEVQGCSRRDYDGS
jgi:hypothetical protein